MSTAHTPGPWRYEAATKTIRAVPSNHWLASMDSWDKAVNHEANAQVLAAAPELLASLLAMIELEKAGDSATNRLATIRAARAVIAKAMGDSAH